MQKLIADGIFLVPSPPEFIRAQKKLWEQAISDFITGKQAAPSSKLNLPRVETRDATDIWPVYIQGVANTYSKWHIPDELVSFIDWEVKPVPIDDYISMRLISEKSLFPLQSVKTTSRQKPETKTKLLETLANKAVLIVGSAGTGKSTCLRYLCYHYASTTLKSISRNPSYWHPDLVVPILISLRHFGKNDLSSLLNSQFRKYDMPLESNSPVSILKNSKFILLLDGLDEVQSKWREDLLSEIAIYNQTFPNIKFVITSRKQPSPELLKEFVWYEVERLKNEAVLRFAEAYLGYSYRYAFMHFIEQNRLEEIIQTPLLLTFCLILFKQNTQDLDSLADIYKQILLLYKTSWEDRKKNKNSPESIDWMILERTLALLAYQMEVSNLGLTVTREQALQILAQETKLLQEEHLWSNEQTTIDLLSQLLFHNLLEVTEDEFGFWHASFQDFFTAMHVSKFSKERMLQLASETLNYQTLAFLGGMLRDSTPLVELLITEIQKARNPSQAIQSLEVLGNMGSEFTPAIIRAISEPSFPEVHYSAYSILESRNFKGKSIFHNVFGLLSTIDEIDAGYLDAGDLESFPDPSQIDFNIFTPIYKQTLLAISQENIDTADRLSKQLFDYIDALAEEELKFDTWLITHDLTDLQVFSSCLRMGKVYLADLTEFCRNTILHSSLPFLEVIIDLSQDHTLRMEANLAIQSIIRS